LANFLAIFRDLTVFLPRWASGSRKSRKAVVLSMGGNPVGSAFDLFKMVK
jgi:hypothetical protein